MKKRKIFKISIIIIVLVLFFSFIYLKFISTNNEKGYKESSLNEPVLYTDLPDPDVINVDGTYYMISTSMHMSPGCAILKSNDLINWKTVNYVYDILADTDYLALRNGLDAYAGGSWAASLRYHDGYYFVSVMSFSTNTSYIFTTDNIENGAWHASLIKEELFYDSSLLFDDDKLYIIYGNSNIWVCELEYYEEDNIMKVRIKENGLKENILTKENFSNIPGDVSPEGAHAYKINGLYYIFLICFSDLGRVELCYISNSINGKYEGDIVFNDSYIAQGGIFFTNEGKCYSMLFQDKGSVGRVPYLIEVSFINNIPIFGNNGKLDDVKLIRVENIDYEITKSDEFTNGDINYFENRYNYSGYKTNISDKTLEELNQYANQELISNNISSWTPTEKGWWIEGDCNISLNNNVILVTNRVDRGEGISQEISNNIFSGYTYNISLDLYYKDTTLYKTAKDSKYFKVGLKLYNSNTLEEEYIDMSNFLVNKESWYYLDFSYTLSTEFSYDKVYFIINQNWWDDDDIASDGTQVGYLSDFYVKNISFSQQYYTGDYYQDGEYDYNGSNLGLQWQFNHNPNNKYWSLTEKEGYLRLTNSNIVNDFYHARNTLTQRTFGPYCSGYTKIELEGMKDGDYCGLGALGYLYGFVGVLCENDKKYIVMYNTFYGEGYDPITFEEQRVPLNQDYIYLKVDFIFYNDNEKIDKAYFYYSLDGDNYYQIGSSLNMQFSLNYFVGYRFALFSYATKETLGYVDFDYFRVLDEVFN